MTNKTYLKATFICSENVIDTAIKRYADSLGSDYTGEEFETSYVEFSAKEFVDRYGKHQGYASVTGETQAIMNIVGEVAAQGEAALVSVQSDY
jgi:hypothetical protein